eukprot:2941793-Alexandrium_andersonii.AAC.1
MFFEQSPPRTAVWKEASRGSTTGPAMSASIAPTKRRKHVGICRGRSWKGHSGSNTFGIQM